MLVESPAVFNKPGSPVLGYRVFFERIRDSLEEARAATEIEHIEAASVAGEGCFCEGTGCQQECPLDKEIPTINSLLRDIDFDYLIKEFGSVMDEIQARLDDCRDMTQEEYMRTARKGYIEALNTIIDSKPPQLRAEISKLQKAIDMQMAASPFAEFTGAVCPAPCEAGGAKGTGCTLKASGTVQSVRIKSGEFDLVALDFALGGMDQRFKIPASVEPLNQKAVIAGAGPAGLEAAYNLARQGVKVVIYDPQDEVGGLLYRGIPDHKFDKDRLVKYRVYLEEMGIELKLGQALTKELYEQEQAEFGEDNTRMLMATGVQNDPKAPSWVEGFDEVSKLIDKETGRPKFEPTIDYLVRNNQDIADRRGKRSLEDSPVVNVTGISGEAIAGTDNKAETTKILRIGGMGAGDTATDGKQSAPRESGALFAMEEQGHYVAFSDRGLAEPLTPRAAQFWGAGNAMEVAAHATAKEDGKMTGAVTLYGASPSKFAVTDAEEIEVTYSFEKSQPYKHNLAKPFRDLAENREADLEAGAIRDANNKVIGLRLRDYKNELIDYPMAENPTFANQFSNKALPKGQKLDGTANGTLTMVYDRFSYALNCRGAGNHPLAKEFALEHNDRSKELDIKNSRTSAPGIYAAGDAGTPPKDWIIVSAQRDGQKAAQAIMDDIGQQRDWSTSRESPVRLKQSSLTRATSAVQDLAAAANKSA